MEAHLVEDDVIQPNLVRPIHFCTKGHQAWCTSETPSLWHLNTLQNEEACHNVRPQSPIAWPGNVPVEKLWLWWWIWGLGKIDFGSFLPTWPNQSSIWPAGKRDRGRRDPDFPRAFVTAARRDPGRPRRGFEPSNIYMKEEKVYN